MDEQEATPGRNADGERRRASPGPVRAASGEPEEPGPSPGRGERLVLGAETGVRRVIQTVAVGLWVPCGFVFWLPFLLRRTVSYVFAVLYTGLVGGDTDRAGRRWEHAVAFYRRGFQRIVHAFRSGDPVPESPGREGREPEGGPGRFVLEFVWAAGVWTALLWLVGLWPDAPRALATAAAALGEGVAETGRRIAAWADGLIGR